MSECNVGQPSDLDDTSDKVETASNEHIDGLVSRGVEPPHDVHGMLNGREDMDTLLRERRHQRRPGRGKFVLRLQVREVGIRNSEGREV